jgi:hypothetical protein
MEHSNRQDYLPVDKIDRIPDAESQLNQSTSSSPCPTVLPSLADSLKSSVVSHRAEFFSLPPLKFTLETWV